MSQESCWRKTGNSSWLADGAEPGRGDVGNIRREFGRQDGGGERTGVRSGVNRVFARGRLQWLVTKQTTATDASARDSGAISLRPLKGCQSSHPQIAAMMNREVLGRCTDVTERCPEVARCRAPTHCLHWFAMANRSASGRQAKNMPRNSAGPVPALLGVLQPSISYLFTELGSPEYGPSLQNGSAQCKPQPRRWRGGSCKMRLASAEGASDAS